MDLVESIAVSRAVHNTACLVLKCGVISDGTSMWCGNPVYFRGKPSEPTQLQSYATKVQCVHEFPVQGMEPPSHRASPLKLFGPEVLGPHSSAFTQRMMLAVSLEVFRVVGGVLSNYFGRCPSCPASPAAPPCPVCPPARGHRRPSGRARRPGPGAGRWTSSSSPCSSACWPGGVCRGARLRRGRRRS